MATVTTLTIDKLLVQYSLSGLDDVVIDVSATLSGNDGGVTAEVTNGFGIAAPDPASFVPFEDLTEEDCENFVKATPRYTTTFQYITALIYDKRQPPTAGPMPLPWE